MKSRRGLAGRVLGVVVLAMGVAGAAEPMSDQRAFEQLKALAGRWDGRIDDAEKGPPVSLQFDVATGGKTVLKRIFPGTPSEMLTVFYMASGKLQATHYCAIGNQPEYAYSAGPDGRMVFDFAGGTGFDPAKDGHVHDGWMQLTGTDRLENVWTYHNQGKRESAMRWFLTRTPGAAPAAPIASAAAAAPPPTSSSAWPTDAPR
jgi:hypothetical protein